MSVGPADAVAGAVLGALGLASGAVVPMLIRAVPPVAVEADDGEPEGPVDVAVVADRPGLVWRVVLACGVAAAVVGLGLGWTWPLLYLVPLVPVSVALAVVDWHTRILPSRLIYPAYPVVVVGGLAAWLLAGRPDGGGSLVRAAIGGLLAFGFFYVVWFVYPRGLGFGDVRLAGLLGLALGYLGWGPLVVGTYAGFLLGGVVGGLLSLARVVDRRGYPFGPFMLAGALLGVLLGQPVWSVLAGGG